MALLGRRLRSRLDALRPQTAEIVRTAQIKQAESTGGIDKDLQVGDTVWARDYSINSNKWAEGRIIAETGPVSYRVDVGKGTPWRRHTDQLIPKSRARYSLTRTADDTEKKRISANMSTSPTDTDVRERTPRSGEGPHSGREEGEETAEPGILPSTSYVTSEPSPQPVVISDRARRAQIRDLRKLEID